MNVFIPLLEKESFLVSVTIGTDLEKANGSYFGIGLSNSWRVSEELPFETLGLVLTSETLRRELGLSSIEILIADEHAKINGFDSEIDRIAKERREFLERVLERLHINSNVILASEITNQPEYTEIRGRITSGNAYERLQIADTEFFRLRRKTIKVGWSHSSMKFDEKHFDEIYKSLFGDSMTFVYTQAGKALDGTPLPPYMHNPTKHRLLLKPDEDIDYKTTQMPKSVRAYFSRLLDLFERTVCGGVINPNNTEHIFKARLKHAYGEIFGGRYV